MSHITVFTGLILIALGLGGYFGTGQTSITALIPAFFGAPILILGILAHKDSLRKHAMHGAVMIGLLGFLGGAFRLVQAAIAGEIKLPVAFALTVAMTVVCGVFVALCVRSFIQARRARQQAEHGGQGS
jgi:hypothetical protein